MRTDMGQPAIVKPSDPIPADYVRAERLKRIVTTNTLLAVGGNGKQWARDMRTIRLRIVGGDAAQRLDAALDHLEKYWKEERCPKPSCPLKLFQKLPFIEMAIQIKAKSQQAPVTISPPAQKVTDRLASMGWPKGSEPLLGAAVQRSFDNAKKFLDGLCWVADAQPKTRVGRFAARLRDQCFISIASHIQAWFEQVHRKVRTWADWSGKLDYYVWSVEHPDVQAWGRGEATANYTGDTWEELMEAIK